MQVAWLGQCFRGNICHTNTKADRALGGCGVGEKGAWEGGEHGETGDRDGRWRWKSWGVGSEDAAAVQVLVRSLVAEQVLGQEPALGLCRCYEVIGG